MQVSGHGIFEYYKHGHATNMPGSVSNSHGVFGLRTSSSHSDKYLQLRLFRLLRTQPERVRSTLLQAEVDFFSLCQPKIRCFSCQLRELLRSSESVILKHFETFLCTPDVSGTIPDHSGHFSEKSKFSEKCRFRACHFSHL